jgi:hypothetical protein
MYSARFQEALSRGNLDKAAKIIMFDTPNSEKLVQLTKDDISTLARLSEVLSKVEISEALQSYAHDLRAVAEGYVPTRYLPGVDCHRPVSPTSPTYCPLARHRTQRPSTALTTMMREKCELVAHLESPFLVHVYAVVQVSNRPSLVRRSQNEEWGFASNISSAELVIAAR